MSRPDPESQDKHPDPWDTLLEGARVIEDRDYAAVERALEGVRRHRARSVLHRALSGGLAAAAVVAGLSLSLWPRPSDTLSAQVAYDVYGEVIGW